MSDERRVQIRLCWSAAGGGIGVSDWQGDTPAVTEAMRDQIEQGAEMTPPAVRWIDVKDAKPRSPEARTMKTGKGELMANKLQAGAPPDPELQKIKDDWALGVGRFVMQFGAVEGWTQRLILTLGSDGVLKALGHTTVKVRCDLIQALAADRNLPDQLALRLGVALKELQRLSAPRNVAAHSGLVFEIIVDDADTVSVNPIIASVGTGKRFALAEIQKLTRKLDELEDTFVEIWRDCFAFLSLQPPSA